MNSKPATIKEIARRLGISPSSVSRGLHDHGSIGSAMKEKIRTVAQELNYEPNQTAIFLQKGKTHTIGVILPELSESFFSSAITAIEDIANKKNYQVMFAQSHDDEAKEKLLVEKMKSHRVDGLIVSVAKSTSSYEHFTKLSSQNIPVVFFDRIPSVTNVHSVACDMETGTIQAVQYLLKKGHRAIGMINGPSNLLASTQRKEGYIKAFGSQRLKYDPSMIVTSDLTENGTLIAMEQLLIIKRKPTAIVAFNDYISLYAIKYARKLGLVINKDIEFVSYSNLPLIHYMDHIPSASVEQHPYLQGQKAADMLMDLLSNKDTEQQGFYRVIIESELVENRTGGIL
ncbi:MAG: LacI family transcriptional regulator [Sphingobacteriaceae bacterium]|jgi:LacI family transcriptional regulator|nr:LacI family transcriptional regulator [Sphingobacteriaceae bacterium]